jgi:hypothetical protein
MFKSSLDKYFGNDDTPVILFLMGVVYDIILFPFELLWGIRIK